MRFLVIVKATKDSEAGVMPSQQLLTDMGKFNEELVKAGVMLAGDGLHGRGVQAEEIPQRIQHTSMRGREDGRIVGRRRPARRGTHHEQANGNPPRAHYLACRLRR